MSVATGLAAAVLAAGAVAVAATSVAADARIDSFSPSGYNKDVRQVAVRFSADMVRLGDPDVPDPFAVRCPTPGSGRWVDERTWVYDFEHDVPGAVQCRFRLRRGTRTLDGASLAGERTHTFNTGGPSIRETLPAHYDQVDERQVFLLALDAVADVASIETQAKCHHDGGLRESPVEVVEGDERTQILAALNNHRHLFQHALELLRDAAGAYLPRFADQSRRDAEAMRRVVLLRCEDSLAPGRRVDLVWSAAITGLNDQGSSDDQVIDFRVRRPFTAENHCAPVPQGCPPYALGFRLTARMPRTYAEHFRLVGPGGTSQTGIAYSVAQGPQLTALTFPGPFREDADYRIELTGPVQDIDGRPLANADDFPLSLRTRLPPGASFFGQLRVVEAGTAPTVPVLLRRPLREHCASCGIHARMIRMHDDQQILDFIRAAAENAKPTIHHDQTGRQHRMPGRWNWPSSPISALAGLDAERVPLALDHSSPYQYLGIPAARGFHAVEVALPRSPIGGFDHVAAGMLVTNMAVHFLRTRESSLVWVTTLADAAPVPDAAVTIADACTGAPIWKGATDTRGLVRAEVRLPPTPDCNLFSGEYLVTARTDDDFSFAITDWAHTEKRLHTPKTLMHVVFDRSLYMPGQRVNMKLVVRTASTEGLAIPAGLPTNAELVIDTLWGESFSQQVRVAADGSAVAHFDLPASARLGWYDVTLRIPGLASDREAKRMRLVQGIPGRAFRVEQFRVGATRGEISLPDYTLVDPDVVPVSVSVSYLSGGAAANLPVTLRTQFRPRGEDHVTTETELTLDEDGRANYEMADLPPIGLGASLKLEMDYFDANGEKTTETAHAELLPAALRVRAEAAGRGPSGERRVRILLEDLDGVPAVGRAVEASLSTADDGYWVDRRLPGGFRTYENRGDGRRIAARCAGKTDQDGVLICPLPEPFYEPWSLYVGVYVSVRAADAQGRIGEFWAHVDHSNGTWRAAPGSNLSLRPINRTRDVPGQPLLPGEVATLEAHLPFDRATGLVTVVREGILDAFVTPLRGPIAQVQVPIRASHAPNVEVSLLAVRGRSQPATPPAAVNAAILVGQQGEPIHRLDAGAPDWARGTTSLRISTARQRLDVAVQADRDVYRVRDEVEVRIAVTNPGGKPAAAGDLAIAVLDEALLERWPARSWQILDGLMKRRPVPTEATTGMRALNQPIDYSRAPAPLAGRPQYMKVSAPGLTERRPTAGQVDRPAVPRENMDSLIHWEGRLRTDARGRAVISFPLNDLLTSFRIVVVASAGADLFGTGETTIRTTQELILRAGLPPTVRVGDRFDATFTVQNATRRKQDVEVVATLDGRRLAARRVALGPGASRELVWQASVPDGVDALAWRLDAAADGATDSLRANQQIHPLVPVEVQQATIRRLDVPVELPIAEPATAIPNRGGVHVRLRASIGVGLDTVREYMRRYPYPSVEQQISAAVALADTEPERWTEAMATAQTALDSGLLCFFPGKRQCGSAILTSYALSIAHAAGKAIPDKMRAAMLHELTLHLRHREAPQASGRSDAWLNSLPLLAALARYDAWEAWMLPENRQNLALAPTSALLDWIDVLSREAPEHRDLATAKRILFARLNLQGTTLGISSTQARDRLPHLLASTDANAARLLLLAFDEPAWRSEIPGLMRGLIGRQQRGRWDTTVANAWGAVATRRFQDEFEAQPVSGASAVRSGGETARLSWPAEGDPAPVLTPWSGAQTLSIEHHGAGAPWGLVAFEAALPIRRPVQRGYRIHREVVAVRRDGATWQRGDVAEVAIRIDADRDMVWVVVEDPIPPGATILGSGLGGDSAMLAASGYSRGDHWPAFTERLHTAYRAYYEHLPKGAATLRYRVRYNTAGRFNLPPTRVEAMYAPEMHAAQPNGSLVIE